MIPNKIRVKVLAKGFDSALGARVVQVFHRWITDGALGEVLVDVTDYRHVFRGPGITLIGHHSSYHLDEHDGVVGLVCVRRRGFSKGGDPLSDALSKAFTACNLLERGLSLEGKLFDTGSLSVSIADRTALTPAFDLEQFATEVSNRLAPFYPLPLNVKVRRGPGLPGVDLRCEQFVPPASILRQLGSYTLPLIS